MLLKQTLSTYYDQKELGANSYYVGRTQSGYLKLHRMRVKDWQQQDCLADLKYFLRESIGNIYVDCACCEDPKQRARFWLAVRTKAKTA
jgi:hypothetical protein